MRMVDWLIKAGSGLVLVAILVWIGALWRNREERAYQAFCRSHGYRYNGDPIGTRDKYASIAEIFGKGNYQDWRDEISGRFNGHHFTAFGYEYTVGYGRLRRTHTFAVVHWTKLGANLPRFTLAPELWFQQVSDRAMGRRSITFGDDEAFWRAYVLKGTDEPALQALFTAQVRASIHHCKGVDIAGEGEHLFAWKHGGLPNPKHFEAFLTEMDLIREQLLG